MSLKAMLKSGHTPTLFASFLYFDFSFMVWVLLGPLAVLIGSDLHLNAAQKGLMVATPSLAGAVLRVVNGLFVDRFGPKKTGIVSQLLVMAGLFVAWRLGVHSFEQVLLLAVVLGVAGAAFAIALPMASSWYPPEHQGLALGIAGAGNSGTVLASLFAPALAVAFGWTNVLGMALIPLVVAFVVFVVLAQDSPRRPAPKPAAAYLKVLSRGDAWGLMGLYGVTFGGFVGLSSSLPIYFHSEYGLSAVTAGLFTAACVFAGSMVRPIGGALADRFGGVRTLTVVLAVAALAIGVVSIGLPSLFLALGAFIVGMLALGMGNGAVFQLAPQRFSGEMGLVTGLVGMTGGFGGFYLASSLGLSKQLTGSYQAGLLIFAGLAFGALLGISAARKRWTATTLAEAQA
ncbi:MAG: major facilitator superfamily 1 [Caulobacteraceae bacterium]|nr:major facilitator superfamily 1 [Caulobacteraceae bacterium]